MSNAIADVLDKAADLIEPEGAWVQYQLGYRADGTRISNAQGIGEAVCFCAAGAIWRASGLPSGEGDEIVWQAFDELRGVGVLDGVGPWNDRKGRTQAEVVAALREAAAKARETV